MRWKRSGRATRRPPRRRRRVLLLATAAFLVLALPAVSSYATTMMQPSSLPLWPGSVEWLRAHHGNWLVDEVEHYYYSWQAPDPGGPQLRTLPTVGVDAPPPASTAARHGASYAPPPI